MCVSSFFTDYQLVVDACVQVTYTPLPNSPAKTETLYPQRHAITLPLNGLNFIFDSCEVTVNHNTKLETNRY